MNVLHSVHDHSFQNFNVLETAYHAYSTSLNQNVALSQKLQRLQCITIWTDQSLSTLDESLLISNKGSDFDNFAEHTVFHDFESLLIGDTTTDEFNDITGFDDAIWVPCLFCGSNDH